MDFVPITEDNRKQMLDAIGARSLEDLLKGIPREIPRADLNLPKGLSEPELLAETQALACRNSTTESHISFLGAGAYGHWIPSVVRYVCSRGEFLTAYTPYQPEASQGTLQAMFEFQSMLCELTGMEAANASLYEGASALTEACLLSLRETGRTKLLIAGTLHPEYRQTLQTYLKHSDARVVEIPAPSGVIDPAQLVGQIDSQVAAVVVQHPNAYGCLESMPVLAEAAHQAGALFVAAVNPISLGLLNPPGAYGADIVVGEGQPLGNELNFGGPYLGLFACSKALIRRMPGRIVGRTRDAQGRTGYVLTLQTREQHIRRARATSNICTNEAMMALAASVTLAALGTKGFQDLALQNLQKAHYCFERLIQIPGIKPLFAKPFFNEFALRIPVDPDQLNHKLFEQGFVGGWALKHWNPEQLNGWLLCVTEARSKEEIDRFVQTVERSV